MLRIKAADAEEVWENIPRNSKILIISAGVGLIAIAGITRYIRWKYFEHRKSSANGDVIKAYCSKCRKHSHQEPSSESKTPEALGAMGLESLEQAIHCWEDALSLLRSSSEKSSLMSRSDIDVETAILNMLRSGQQLKESGKAIFASDEPSTMTEERNDGEDVVRKRLGTDTDSFVSAEGASDVGQLSDVEQFPPPYAENWPLYMSAVALLESKGIPCRAYRLQEFNCTNENDYLVRMHCVRLAFQHLAKQEDIQQWFINAGSQLLAALLIRAGKDPKDAIQSYDEFMLYILDPQNGDEMEKELKGRGIVCVTIYDVFIDYMLMDAFDDLSNPPTTVVAVTQNRWLTDGFKETALSTAVWSLIKAKKALLQHSNGFFAHYYNLAEHLTPVFAWGFLGTNQDLCIMCNFFKNEIEGLVRDMFDHNCTRYTTVEDISTDIFNNIHARYDKVCQRLLF
ncbi:mitoguardin-like [Ornithodoros turicata]